MTSILSELARELGTDAESLRDALFAGDESLQPTYVTVDATGVVTATFTGHVQAGGLDIIADTSQSLTRPDRKVRWHQDDYGGPVVAELAASDDAAALTDVLALRSFGQFGHTASTQLAAISSGGNSAIVRAISADGAGGASRVTITALDDDTSASKTVLDSDGVSGFLFGLGYQVVVKFNTGAVAVPAAAPAGVPGSNSVNIVHNLNLPNVGTGSQFVIGSSSDNAIPIFDSFTANQFRAFFFNYETGGARNGNFSGLLCAKIP